MRTPEQRGIDPDTGAPVFRCNVLFRERAWTLSVMKPEYRRLYWPTARSLDLRDGTELC